MPDFAGDIYYQSTLPVPEQLRLLDPVLREWIGADYMHHYIPAAQHLSYRPSDRRLIGIGWNGGYGKSFHDHDRFRCRLVYIDDTGEWTEAQHLDRFARALDLLWRHGIPTCTPGWEESLPHAGGEDGPVRWP